MFDDSGQLQKLRRSVSRPKGLRNGRQEFVDLGQPAIAHRCSLFFCGTPPLPIGQRIRVIQIGLIGRFDLFTELEFDLLGVPLGQ